MQKLIEIKRTGSIKFSHDFLVGVASDVASTIINLGKKNIYDDKKHMHLNCIPQHFVVLCPVLHALFSSLKANVFGS